MQCDDLFALEAPRTSPLDLLTLSVSSSAPTACTFPRLSLQRSDPEPACLREPMPSEPFQLPAALELHPRLPHRGEA